MGEFAYTEQSVLRKDEHLIFKFVENLASVIVEIKVSEMLVLRLQGAQWA